MSFNRFSQLNILAFALLLNSCSSIDSTFDSISESVSTAGDYIYDSVNFWEDEDEPEQSDAIIIEEAVEVPDYALPDQDYLDQNRSYSEVLIAAHTMYFLLYQVNIYINTPGGSVMEGMKIVNQIELMNNTTQVNCISDFSASMAFFNS